MGVFRNCLRIVSAARPICDMEGDDELESRDPISAQFGIVPAPRDLEARDEWLEFHRVLSASVEDLLEHDFNRLQAILYVMDVDENRAAKAFALRDPRQISAEVANLMIERHVARLRSRKERQQ